LRVQLGPFSSRPPGGGEPPFARLIIRTAVILDLSCAGLTRASIFFARKPFAKIDGLPGQARQ
jgi:hypothetical protein